MPFCATCGSQVEGRFCAKCGSAAAVAAGPGGAGASAQATAVNAGMADNVASALCYALGLITGILFLVLAPYNQNKAIRFHAFQSIFMHLGLIALWIVLDVVVAFTHMFLIIGALFPLIGLASFGLWIFLLISAYQGKKIVLPLVGPIAEQQA